MIDDVITRAWIGVNWVAGNRCNFVDRYARISQLIEQTTRGEPDGLQVIRMFAPVYGRYDTFFGVQSDRSAQSTIGDALAELSARVGAGADVGDFSSSTYLVLREMCRSKAIKKSTNVEMFDSNSISNLDPSEWLGKHHVFIGMKTNILCIDKIAEEIKRELDKLSTFVSSPWVIDQVTGDFDLVFVAAIRPECPARIESTPGTHGNNGGALMDVLRSTNGILSTETLFGHGIVRS